MNRATSCNHPLLDAAEQIASGGIEHLYLDRIPRLHEACLRRTLLDDLDHAPFSQARNTACAIGVRHRSAAQNRARGERARLGDVRDQIEKRKLHLGAGLGITHQRAVEE